MLGDGFTMWQKSSKVVPVWSLKLWQINYQGKSCEVEGFEKFVWFKSDSDVTKNRICVDLYEYSYSSFSLVSRSLSTYWY